MSVRHILGKILVAGSLAIVSNPVNAFHQWADYHWETSTGEVSLTIINSTTSEWDSHVTTAIGDWNFSSVLNLTEDTGGSTSNNVRRRCKAGNGVVRICNLAYGQNGWLGIAGISVSGGHIVSGYTKLNDTYFNSPYYDHYDWRQSVTCQELGHNFGLGHQDEDFDNNSLSTCMDYQDPPHEDPNDHDYDELIAMYAHPHDGGGDGGGDGECNAPPGKGCNKNGNAGALDPGSEGWGASLGRRGNAETFIRIDHDGTLHLTHVTWAIGY
jgi:hypothetical protein